MPLAQQRSARLAAALLGITLLSPTTQASHPLEGKPAPRFTLKTMAGKPFRLDKVKSPVIVLDFWATWCGPCRMGLPLLQQFSDWAKKNKKPVSVYTVNLQEHPSKPRAYWKQKKFNMPVLMDTDGRVGEAYGVNGIPHTVIIHNGKIARIHVGYSPDLKDRLKSDVEALLDQEQQEQDR